MRQTVQIPADGEKINVPLTGISVIIEAAGTYETVDDVPVLAFDRPGNDFPIYPRSQYQNPQGEFNKIVITGTTESEGDDITLVSFQECLESEVNIVYSGSFRATLIDTFSITSTDAAQSIPELQLTNADGKLPSKIYIAARDNEILYSFGSDPVQGGDGYVMSADSEPIEITGINFITEFKFISSASGVHGDLIITPEY